jgi:hypothetical protein
MLILFTILVVFSAVVTIWIFLKTRENRDYLTSNPPKEIEPHLRSLFEPGEEEIRSREREEKAKTEAQKAVEMRRILDGKAKKLNEFKEFWKTSPNRQTTVRLLSLAAQTESGKVFSETAENVLQQWQAKRIEDLSAEQLAQILDSHFWLLPNEERTPGVSFWLKQEIASLRRNTVGKN